ncbi:MAG: PKD domain-containing protein, partial [Thermoplasmatota archaeon]
PKRNMHGTESFQLKAYDDHSSAVRYPALRIMPVNDPPVVYFVRIDGVNYPVDNIDPLRPVIHLEDEIEVYQDQEFSFQIIAMDSDPEGERSPLEFSYERSYSDSWDETPEVEYNTGIVTVYPTNNDVRAGNGKITIGIDDHGEDGEIFLGVYIEIIDVNNPPSIMIPTITARTWNQFSKMSITPIAMDEDRNDQITFSVNFEEQLGNEYEPIVDQLPYMDVRKGIDWDINPITGEFWFQIDDQNIWKTGSGMVQSVEITVVFQAMDMAGESSTASISLILNDENEEPQKPDRIYFTPSNLYKRYPVHFWVDTVLDPDGDLLFYKWDFGDGSTGTGQHVNHTYSTHGWKTVQMWVEDGQFATEKISLRVWVEEGIPPDPCYDEDNDGDGVRNGQDDFVNDISASKDSDGDGHPDEWNPGYNHVDSTTGLTLDRFPYDRTEWQDSDGDGHGDNGDEFPYDPSEWKDSDGDGIGDNADRYPRVNNDNLKWYAIGATIILMFVIGVLLLVLRRTIKGSQRDYLEE